MTDPIPADPSNDSSTTPPRKRRRLLRLLVGVGLLVLLILVLVLLIPSVISTASGTRWVMNKVSEAIHGSVDAGNIDFAWFGGQTIERLTLADPDGQSVVTVDSIRLPDVSIWGLATGKRALGQINIAGVNGTITRDDTGRTNLQKAIEPTGTASTPPPVPVGPNENDTASGIPMDLALTLAVRDLKVTYEQRGTEPAVMTVPKLDVAVAGLRDITVKTEATLVQGGDTGSLSLDATIRDLLDDKGQLDPAAKVTADGRLASVPIAALDRIAGQDGKLVALLGPTLDAGLKADGDADRADIRLTAAAKQLDVNADLVLTSDAITAGDKTTARLTLTPAAWKLFAGESGELVEPVTLSADLSRLNVPRTQSTLALPDAAGELLVSISDTALVTPQVGRVAFTGTKLVLKTDRLADAATFNLASSATVEGKTGSVAIDGDVRQFLNDAGELNLAGAVANVTGKTRDFPAIVLADAVAGQEGRLVAALGPALNADFEAHWKDDAGTLDLTTAVQGNSGRADITSKSRVARNEAGDVLLQSTQTTVTGLPVALVETLADSGGKLATLLGPTLERIVINVTGDPRSESKFDVAVASPNLKADLAGTYRADGVTLSPESGGSLTVSPQAFASYLAQANEGQTAEMRLIDPVTFTLAVPRATVALPFDPAKVDVKATVAMSTMALARADGSRLGIENFNFDLTIPNLRDKATLKLTGNVGSDAATKGELRSDTTLANLYNAQGEIDTAGITIVTDTALTGLPIDLIDQLGGYNGQLVAMAGDRADLTAKGQAPGTLRLNVQSPVVRAPMALEISADRQVTLAEDFTAEMTPTPQTFELILGKVQPILADAVAAEKPMTLTIRKEGLVVPTEEFDLAKVRANGEINIGQLRMDRQGWFNQAIVEVFARLVESLGLPRGKTRGGGETYLATFTPMTFEMADGKVATSQLWMTSQDMAAGFDTKVDLVNNRLDMMMGLVGATLSAGLPVIRKGIDPAAIYDIPVRGDLSDPKPDTVPLVTGIVANTAGSIGGLFGEDGGKIGDIIGKVAGGVTKASLASSNRDWKPPTAVAEFVEAQGGDPRKIDPNYVPKEKPQAMPDAQPPQSDPPKEQPKKPAQQGLELLGELLKKL